MPQGNSRWSSAVKSKITLNVIENINERNDDDESSENAFPYRANNEHLDSHAV